MVHASHSRARALLQATSLALEALLGLSEHVLVGQSADGAEQTLADRALEWLETEGQLYPRLGDSLLKIRASARAVVAAWEAKNVCGRPEDARVVASPFPLPATLINPRIRGRSSENMSLSKCALKIGPIAPAQVELKRACKKAQKGKQGDRHSWAGRLAQSVACGLRNTNALFTALVLSPTLDCERWQKAFVFVTVFYTMYVGQRHLSEGICSGYRSPSSAAGFTVCRNVFLSTITPCAGFW